MFADHLTVGIEGGVHDTSSQKLNDLLTNYRLMCSITLFESERSNYVPKIEMGNRELQVIEEVRVD